jgi:hypothetical protein
MKSHRTDANNNEHHGGAKYFTSSYQITIQILGCRGMTFLVQILTVLLKLWTFTKYSASFID